MAQVTTKKAAQILGVSDASIKRWCDGGQLESTKTPGGHRRLSEKDLIAFARKKQYPLARPELLAMSETPELLGMPMNEAQPYFLQALLEDDSARLQAMIVDWHISGSPLHQIFDSVVAPVFTEIGHRWSQKTLTVSQERRACLLFEQVVRELAPKLIPPPQNNLLATGGALSADWYSIPVTMVDMVLRQQRWNTMSLGNHLPASSMISAIERYRPQLFWISVGFIEDEDQFIKDVAEITEACRASNSFLIMGGRSLSAELRRQMDYSVYCDTLTHMVGLLDRIFKATKND